MASSSGPILSRGLTVPDKSADPFGGFIRTLVLPNAHNRPSRGLELCRVPAIALDIAADLRIPVVAVRPWPDSVLGTLVPEAPVHQYCDLNRAEADVDSTRAGDGLHMDAIPQASTVEC